MGQTVLFDYFYGGQSDAFSYYRIYYALDEIQRDLNCGHDKAVKLLAELDSAKASA